MNKRAFYKEKVVSFKDHASKNEGKELFPLFSEWADSNGIYGVERQEIWRRARKMQPCRTIEIKENSDEFVRLNAVLDILLEADLKYLNKLMQKGAACEKEKA
ncbi:MAG: hypothetical protein JW844_04700 [Candidatus Omnitrophica bacterium]|nr:hypothetical protein [Candidatus Omnitrophota bacterium]